MQAVLPPPAFLATLRAVERTYWRLGVRDGWECAYCSVGLIPPGLEGVYCHREPEHVDYEWCGCGRHTAQGGELPMPCVRSACWILPPGFEMPQQDHVVPRCRQGSDELANLVLSCAACNSRKGTMDVRVFRARMLV